MDGSTDSAVAIKEDSPISARIGRVRWSICAMLFAATTINYMDRQVIGILKPTLQASIGMSELDYGYVVDAFQLAYALGLLMAGRFVDRMATRSGYMVIMALWSLSAMGHALANTVLQFGIARACLGIGESGNFPAAIKTTDEWFPQSERSLVTGMFSPSWIVLWFFKYHKPTEHPALGAAEFEYINKGIIEKPGPSTPWIKLFGYRQTWAFTLGKFLTDPIWWFYLFWLPSYFTQRFHLNLSHLGLPLIIVYNCTTIGSI